LVNSWSEAMLPALLAFPLDGGMRVDLHLRMSGQTLLKPFLDVQRIGVARVAQDLQYLALRRAVLFGEQPDDLVPAMWPISIVPATEVKSDGVEVICRSKIMTGMPAARAFSIPLLAASKSTAASTIAEGFRLITSSIWFSCRSLRFCASSDTTS
jgi:hypothetical protein